MSGRVLTQRDDIASLLRAARRVAVLGIKTERQAGEPAFYVPQYLQAAGLEIVPVPVYYPEITHILGAPVVRRVQDAPGEIDILDVFRRPADLAPHLDDIIAKGPKLVWLQSGIRDDGFARALTQHGMHVVQDRCLMVDHRSLAARA
jgi:predicted CoA-binding protein